ncbi:Apl3p KNAG_0H00860 [Huiozyma naganishii CBS 8797]|uniref:AP-2 complex subunit alpha n=1 Tax=Huiozyma naganishii (strain ATCC MYA-139 / BCRC 22969 / CBS 8797 / KCTC 17520 / NBRC 10181 / NCYC 3082 / Yp74L-3) TaxID=1071383 RepID=J7S9H9_HUIN7|nr:hypothetical protein KNAG_0H00860 [Kazachstania naganishii CBS 8797]CCK71501.1 hypothetical protein KNAG_0H00860 [Kazachstania naganishii CBS 8797]
MDTRKAFKAAVVSSNGTVIKGLQIFIADLRASPHSADHEKRIKSEIVKIKQQFEASNSTHGGDKLHQDRLGGYQRKKYVAKLAYIYLTSNTTKLADILFGLDQTLILLKSNVYSEKFIGYMLLELLMEHKSVAAEIGERLVPYVTKDVSSSNDNFTALALNFLGVVGGMCTKFAFNEDLVDEVFQIVRSPTSSQYLKKKSVLAFLVLLKANLSILTDNIKRKQIWIQRIVSLLDDTDNYRLTLASLPLVEYIARNIGPSYCVRLLPQLTDILYDCIVLGTSTGKSNHFPTEYKFANMPNPWLITKTVSLLNAIMVSPKEEYESQNSQLLQSANIDPENLGKLRMCVAKAVELGTRRINDPMEKIVQNTVLFSLINFAPKLDPSEVAITNSVDALCELLRSNEINIRYLTLDSLIKLCSSCGKIALDAVRYKNMNLIFHLLNSERDSSIARKVIDLLYILSDKDNVKTVVDQLLSYIVNAKYIPDPQIRSNISVKIAILTEKYATDSTWYVQISLKILSMNFSTSFNDDEVWHRLCQIVVNNPSLRKITCVQLVEYLQGKQLSEFIVKTAAFLLGEYVELIRDIITATDMFNLFSEKYFMVGNLTRAMILTTMMKLHNSAPEVGSKVIKFYQLELNSLDIELQTRSFEYLKVIQLSKISGNNNLIELLFQPMPPFNTKSNPLLNRLGSLPLDTTTNSSPLKEGTVAPPPYTSTASLPLVNVPKPPISRHSGSMMSFPSTTGNSNTLLRGLDSSYADQQLSPNWREGFSRMLQHKQGIFYNSSLMKIVYRIIHVEPHHLKIVLTCINNTEWEINGLSTSVISARTHDNPEYVVQNIEFPSNPTIQPHKRQGQQMEVIIRRSMDVQESPILNINFRCGGSVNNLSLKLGIGMTSTIFHGDSDAHPQQQVTLPQFITRWKALGNTLGKDSECVVESMPMRGLRAPDTDPDSTDILVGQISQILKRMGFDIVEQDTVKNPVFAAGIVHTKSEGNFGSLLKVQCRVDGKINVTCKTTVPGPLSSYIVECIKTTVAG